MAKAAAADSDHCKACGSDSLFSGFFGRDGLANHDDNYPGVRYTTVCQDCGQFQDRPVRKGK